MLITIPHAQVGFQFSTARSSSWAPSPIVFIPAVLQQQLSFPDTIPLGTL